MNLLERAQSLSVEIARSEALKIRADHAGLLEQRAAALTGPAIDMHRLESAMDVMRDLSIRAPSLDQALTGVLRRRVDDLKRRYAADKNVILQPFEGEDVRHVLFGPLEKFPKKLAVALQEAWAAWAREVLPNIDDDVLDILFGVPALRDSVAHLRTLRDRANAVCSALPSGAEDVESLKKLGEEIKEGWHNLGGDGIPVEVLHFLRAAGGPGGAEYTLLTAEVMEWLSAHGLKHSLRIRMG